ncbi:MAG: NADH-quinone oxidoreductase subunit J [Burkholderiaceae bacterium]
MITTLVTSLATLAALSGWLVFRVDSMVRATMALLLSFVAVGAIAFVLGAGYIGASTWFMMIVEMLVMAVFMVMFMMNPAGLNPMSMVHQQRLAALTAVLAFIAMTVAIVTSDLPTDHPRPAGADVEALGRLLLGDAMLVFETVGIVLLTTMIATVVLSARSGRAGRADEGSRPPGLFPGGSPAGAATDDDAGQPGLDRGGPATATGALR